MEAELPSETSISICNMRRIPEVSNLQQTHEAVVLTRTRKLPTSNPGPERDNRYWISSVIPANAGIGPQLYYDHFLPR
jgi:hypothetical protein